MPRPKRCRRVCRMPGSQSFGPLGGAAAGTIAMSVDEFEAVRLIDLEGFTQEECAAQMNVARTTAQAIYAGARRKLAQCLVQGMRLTIGGGEYVLCEGNAPGCGGCPKGRCCGERAYQEREEKEDENSGAL